MIVMSFNEIQNQNEDLYAVTYQKSVKSCELLNKPSSYLNALLEEFAKSIKDPAVGGVKNIEIVTTVYNCADGEYVQYLLYGTAVKIL